MAQDSVLEPVKASKERFRLHNATIELLTTEKTYIRGLKTLSHSFILRFRKRLELGVAPVLLSENDITTVFSNIESICALNCTLYGELKGLYDEGVDVLFEGIGPLFERMIPFFMVYTVYCNAYDKAASKLTDLLQSRPALQRHLEVEQCCESGMSLQSFLIMPIQRLPRYVLLLSEMVKLAPAGMRGAGAIERALGKVKKLASGVNDKMGHWIAKEKVVQIAGKFVVAVDLLAPNRFAVHDGWLWKVHQHQKGTKKYRVFVFNDMIVFATSLQGKGREKLRMKRTLKLEAMEVHDMSDGEGITNRFLITSADDNEKDIIVHAASLSDKEEWLQTLGDTITKAKEHARQGQGHITRAPTPSKSVGSPSKSKGT